MYVYREVTQEILDKAHVICFDCGEDWGYKKPGVCTVYKRICDICTNERSCTEVRDFGGLIHVLPQENDEIREFIRHSNAIEGVVDEQSFTDAFDAWNYLKDKKVITVKVVNEAHRILMQNQDIPKSQLGQLRHPDPEIGFSGMVGVDGREGLHFYELPSKMEDWCNHITQFSSMKSNNKTAKFNSFVAKRDHIHFEKMHPYYDGNGRIGRLLFLYMYVRMEMRLKVIREKDKYKYYKWFTEIRI